MKRHKFSRLVRFGITGSLNTGIDWLVFFLLSKAIGLPPALAQAIAYSCGVANSWLLNSRWVFGVKRATVRAAENPGLHAPDRFKPLRFILVTGLSTAATSLAMHWLATVPDLPLWVAKAAVTILGMGLNYLLYSGWVFAGIKPVRPRSAKKVPPSE